MKYSYKISFLTFIALILWCNSGLNAQTRFGVQLLNNYVSSQTSISNTLYVGIDNRLIIDESLKIGYDTLIFKTNNGKILFDSTYFIIPRRDGKLRIEVHGIADNNVDTLGFYMFKVLPFPRAHIAFDNLILTDSMKVSIESFLMVDSIYIVVSEDIPDSRTWIKINEFSLGYNYGGYFIGATSSTNSITPEMKNIVFREGAGRYFSIKVITQSAGSLLHTNPLYRVFFY